MIKIKFIDFWSHFDPKDNFFIELLSQNFNVELSDEPDLLIYSCYGNEHLKFNCHKLFYNGENMRINWNACDFAIGFDYLKDKRYYRLPNWIWYSDVKKLTLSKESSQKVLSRKDKFCNMVVSNPHAKKRIDFFNELSKYKKVDSGGRYLNNIGGPVKDKIEFLKPYRFTMAFENSSYPGYTTEKLLEPMFANSIPIYWGNPIVGRDFNTKSFINAHDFSSTKDLINYIKLLDSDDEMYLEMLAEPWFIGNKVPECFNKNNIANFFVSVFEQMLHNPAVSGTYKRYLYWTQQKIKSIDFILNSKLQYRKDFR